MRSFVALYSLKWFCSACIFMIFLMVFCGLKFGYMVSFLYRATVQTFSVHCQLVKVVLNMCFCIGSVKLARGKTKP